MFVVCNFVWCLAEGHIFSLHWNVLSTETQCHVHWWRILFWQWQLLCLRLPSVWNTHCKWLLPYGFKRNFVKIICFWILIAFFCYLNALLWHQFMQACLSHFVLANVAILYWWLKWICDNVCTILSMACTLPAEFWQQYFMFVWHVAQTYNQFAPFSTGCFTHTHSHYMDLLENTLVGREEMNSGAGGREENRLR